jgi:hypothetical protein
MTHQTLAALAPHAAYTRGDIMDDTTITTPGTTRVSGAAAGRRRLTRTLGATAVSLLAALAVGAPAHAALTAVGPVVPRHGFPDYYQDATGLRLTLCVENEDPFCSNVAPDPGPATVSTDPAQSNFPDETFYWSAQALIDKRSVGVRARLVLAQEAAFANDAVAAGDQITFGRIRVRIDGAQPGATYTVTHPYGTEHITADGRGRVRMTDDVGCGATPCDFTDALATRIGPFLRWDPKSPPAAPAGYVGNPLREHTVVGSPRGAAFNVFRVTGPDIGGPGDDTIETHLFTVEGKAATTQGTAPGTTAPGTTAPATTAPGTTAPGTTAPGTTPPAGGTAPTAPAPGATPTTPPSRRPIAPAMPNLPGLPPLPPIPALSILQHLPGL